MQDTINLKQVFTILKKSWKLITLITMIAVLISGLISYFALTPVYQATAQILVNQKNSESPLDITRMQGNVELINTYSEIIKSPAILEKVIEQLALSQGVAQLNQNISVTIQENSQVFSLSVKDNDATKAVEIANAVSETFQKEIPGIMNVDNVSILAKAKFIKNPAPVSPNPIMNIAIALVIGLMFGIGLAFLLEYLDNTLVNAQDVEAVLGLPVLGSIQKISQEKLKKDSTIQKMVGEPLESQVER
ncbi:YveK family protein [Peribacillus glennii]|uniref:Capsular biosynthesis protein n=1 Tax=Peribacillus glennii TaxID=2303991 RepID=A0A372LFG6_9BACI|nr:Wzz/FepE/Etk N-terminal domain-containing protein [Peribacillus glennii]RFU64754.1 capsular biosynthesis protein [Peribacillus glennii]